ncbi:MAG: crossover junction endodeoxyribonuclease RuvC [Endomicrobia bacterium]|nr:crossover junction endodeoxyribonuclease RuvC [Endomicrobiia bacterium]
MRVLGIDPGLSRCGWALIEKDIGKKYKLISYGEIETKLLKENPSDITQRLKKIFLGLKKILIQYKPNIICIESQFYSKISKNMINTYFATGIIYLLSALYNTELKEFPAKTVKLSVTGYGSASKLQIRKMIKLLLEIEKEITSEHINDAISVALCYFNTQSELYV